MDKSDLVKRISDIVYSSNMEQIPIVRYSTNNVKYFLVKCKGSIYLRKIVNKKHEKEMEISKLKDITLGNILSDIGDYNDRKDVESSMVKFIMEF